MRISDWSSDVCSSDLRCCASRCSTSTTASSTRADEETMYGSKQIAPGRYREDIGRSYDDFTVGDVYEHRPGRTITEADNVWFTLLTMNTHPLHFDNEHAAQSEFGRRSEEHTSELPSLMRISYAVFCLKQKHPQ